MSSSKLSTPMGLFGITFLYVLFSGSLVQFLVLPYLFPDLHAGDGLLKGVDTILFHHQALELLAQMNVKGWSVWSLRPDGMNSPPGIMAAMYYLLVPKPYVLLLLNGFLWGITAVTWFAIFERIFPRNGKWNVIPILLMVTLPSSLQWTSQFLKDTPSNTGVSLFFYAFIQSVVYEKEDIAKWVRSLGIPLLLGSFFIWIVRPYVLQFLVAGSLAALTIVGVAYLVRRAPRGLMTMTTAVAIITLLLGLIGNAVFVVKDPRHDRLNLTVPIVCHSNFVTCGVLRLQSIRDGYCGNKNKVGGSAIDCDVKLTSISDAIAYLPRAVEIAMLSPFPDVWFAKAKMPGGSQMRLVAGAETVLAYLIFSLALILLISGRARLSLPMVLGMTYLLTPLLIETYANPEIGTLYRMRYIFWTGLVAMSLGLIISHLLFLKQMGRIKLYKLKNWRVGVASN